MSKNVMPNFYPLNFSAVVIYKEETILCVAQIFFFLLCDYCVSIIYIFITFTSNWFLYAIDYYLGE